jgi:hypothetical protein
MPRIISEPVLEKSSVPGVPIKAVVFLPSDESISGYKFIHLEVLRPLEHPLYPGPTISNFIVINLP